MVFVKHVPLVTFFPISLTSGQPLLGTMGNPLLLPSISLKLLTGYGIRLWYPNFLAMALLLLSVSSFPVFSLTALFLLLLKGLLLAASLSTVVFLRDLSCLLFSSFSSSTTFSPPAQILSMLTLMTPLFTHLLPLLLNLLLKLVLPLRLLWPTLRTKTWPGFLDGTIKV